MAKIALTKLGLKPNTEIKVIEWNGQSVEVKQYLPIENTLQLISTILSETVDDNPYYNSCKLHIYTTLEIIYAYTNISFTEKQKLDVFKLFDMFANGLGEKILDAIPEDQIEFICSNCKDILDSIYKYKSSALGIVEAITSDYSNLQLDAQDLQRKIGDPENLNMLKEIMTYLG